ncbi:MAG: chemotaxis protein CheB [Pseudomonadota bacterium]|nr:chemotaxis protein CheB [Pseudomonadota bacterium]
MRILIAEDDATSAYLLERILRKNGHEVVAATDGQQALTLSQGQRFDAVLTDWMMPHLDGIELIRRIRSGHQPPPFVMVVTALASDQAREYALKAGADDYLAKPYTGPDLLARLRDGLARSQQPMPAAAAPPPPVPADAKAPPFLGVCLAASSGGPEAVKAVLRDFKSPPAAAFYIALHGPHWMLETLAARLRDETPLPVHLADNGQASAAGEIYLAPGDRHLLVEADSLRLRLTDDPPENYVRPAADPLFRSVAHAFGRHCIGVVLTGLGRDGTAGAAQVAAAGGAVIVQDPGTALAASMPQSVIDSGCAAQTAPLEQIAGLIRRRIQQLAP